MHAWSIEVSQTCFLHTCSGLRFLASKATDPDLQGASAWILCILTDLAEFVVGFEKILTEVGNVLQLRNNLELVPRFVVDACSSRAA